MIIAHLFRIVNSKTGLSLIFFRIFALFLTKNDKKTDSRFFLLEKYCVLCYNTPFFNEDYHRGGLLRTGFSL